MRMQHFLIEGYCDGKEGEKNYACEGILRFGLYCLRCPQFSYTKCPNEISVSNDEGLIKEQEDYIDPRLAKLKDYFKGAGGATRQPSDAWIFGG